MICILLLYNTYSSIPKCCVLPESPIVLRVMPPPPRFLLFPLQFFGGIPLLYGNRGQHWAGWARRCCVPANACQLGPGHVLLDPLVFHLPSLLQDLISWCVVSPARPSRVENSFRDESSGCFLSWSDLFRCNLLFYYPCGIQNTLVIPVTWFLQLHLTLFLWYISIVVR